MGHVGRYLAWARVTVGVEGSPTVGCEKHDNVGHPENATKTIMQASTPGYWQRTITENQKKRKDGRKKKSTTQVGEKEGNRAARKKKKNRNSQQTKLYRKADDVIQTPTSEPATIFGFGLPLLKESEYYCSMVYDLRAISDESRAHAAVVVARKKTSATIEVAVFK